MTENWKSHGVPFQEFTEKTTQEWIDKGFSKNQCKEWLDIGMKVGDAGFCQWIRDIIEETPKNVLDTETDLNELREQYSEYLKKNLKPDEEEIVPDWLFGEETEKPAEPKKRPQKSPKPTKPKEKPWECQICEKNTFYTRQEYIQAHGPAPKLEPSCWVYKTIIICKKPIVTKSMWICKVCKQEYHADKCKYYSPVKPIIPIPEPFDWESYWKWWFGVNTLDWDSPRFFG